jgi:hypothetical protein
MATQEVEVVDMAAAAVVMEVVQAVIACLTSELVYRSKAGVSLIYSILIAGAQANNFKISTPCQSSRSRSTRRIP